MLIRRRYRSYRKITELRKHKLKVEIVHDSKEFWKDFKILFAFYNNLGLILFYFQNIATLE